MSSHDDTEDASSFQHVLTEIGTDVKTIQTESLCINCLEQGVTTILLTKIRFFKDIMISRFECANCGYTEKSVQFSGGRSSDKGVHYELHVSTPDDLNRRIVKSAECTIFVQPIHLEIPGPTHGNSISTIEGILGQCFDDMQNVKQTPKIVEFLNELQKCKTGEVEFDFVLDDPSGNSFIESPGAPDEDLRLKVSFYTTKKKEEIPEKISTENSECFYYENDSVDYIKSIMQNNDVVKIPFSCPQCDADNFIDSCTLKIQDFKEVEIKDFTCCNCGYHNGQVFIKGDLSPLARTITLTCDSVDDLNRQVLKSETCSIKIPEVDLELSEGIISGKLTNVEGILRAIQKRLIENNPFTKKDTSLVPKFDVVLEMLEKFINNQEKFTIILRDPLSNSYIQKFENDKKIMIVDEPRTEKENEDLCLNEVNDENYLTGNPTFNSVLRAFKEQPDE